MSSTIGNAIADSLQMSLGYSERLLNDVPADMFARLATPGGQLVQSNHPAFVFGHLSLYSQRIVENLGGDPATAAPPENFNDVFSKDAVCQDDPEGSLYPEMTQITDTYFNGYRIALEFLRNADGGTLSQPNPLGGRMTELFPTMGSMHAFYCGGHIMMHLGQVSAWRRMQGLGAA